MDNIERSKVKMEIPYFQVPNSIFDLDLRLNTYEKITYLYLCRCCNQGATAFPSYKTIGIKCGFSRITAIRSVATLIKAGLLEKETRTDNVKNLSNIYILNQPVDKIEPSICEIPPSICEIPPPSICEIPPSICEIPYKEPLYKEPKKDKEILKKGRKESIYSNHSSDVWKEQNKDMLKGLGMNLD